MYTVQYRCRTATRLLYVCTLRIDIAENCFNSSGKFITILCILIILLYIVNEATILFWVVFCMDIFLRKMSLYKNAQICIE